MGGPRESSPEGRTPGRKLALLQEMPQKKEVAWFRVTRRQIRTVVNVGGRKCFLTVSALQAAFMVVSAPSAGECKLMCTLWGKCGRRGASGSR